uniref:F-box protein At5g52880 n=1 Tax=Elaeis guineensis var. tenera TaxID=51953 RepID=A0A6I9QXP0_ELAGV|nr:F-box protein At5g52880 [Elaeis guineensis]
MGGATPSERYEELGLAEALSRPYDYPTACRELGLILRLAYGKLSKGLQSIVFRDTLSAFRLLPQVQTGNGISSANILLQAAEVVLPKQKKALAVSEFKHAVVAHKRRSRAHEDGGSMQLPHDVLVHIFSFLDMRSLVTASSVCWAWNSAASDGTLWQLQYSLLFGEYDVSCLQTGKLVQVKDVVFHQGIECVDATFYAMTNLNWKEAYRRKYLGNSSLRFTSNRASCVRCKSIIWLSNMTCARSHHCHKLKNQRVKIRPVSPNKVVNYLLGETELTMSSSESDDSDTDELSNHGQRLMKLWAYPRLTSTS